MEIKFSLKRIGKFVGVFIFIITSQLSFAQGGVFSIVLSSDSVHVDDLIKVDIKLENNDGTIELPKFDGFQILSGPNVSTQVSIVNGVKTQMQSYSLIIQAKEVGNLFIDECYLNQGDTVHSLESIPVVVNPKNGPSNKTNISYSRTYKASINLDGEEVKETPKKNKPKRIKKRI